MNGGAWWVTVLGVARSQTHLSNFYDLEFHMRHRSNDGFFFWILGRIKHIKCFTWLLVCYRKSYFPSYSSISKTSCPFTSFFFFFLSNNNLMLTEDALLGKNRDFSRKWLFILWASFRYPLWREAWCYHSDILSGHCPSMAPRTSRLELWSDRPKSVSCTIIYTHLGKFAFWFRVSYDYLEIP